MHKKYKRYRHSATESTYLCCPVAPPVGYMWHFLLLLFTSSRDGNAISMYYFETIFLWLCFTDSQFDG